MSRKTVVAAAALVILGLLVSLSVSAGGQKEGAKSKKQYHIAHFWPIVSVPYPATAIPATKRIIEAAGHKVTLFDANLDANLQANQVDDAITMGVDGMILFPVDSKAIVPALKKAFDAGIPVLISYAKVPKEAEPYTIGYAGPDDYKAGYLAGGMLHDALKGKGKVAMIEGAAGQEQTILRAKGFEDRLQELKSGLQLVARQNCPWDKAEATKIMEDFLVRYPDLAGVFAQDDPMGSGAALAIEEAGIPAGKIVVLGYGGSKDGLADIVNGRLYGTHLQSPIFTGELEGKRILEFLDKGMKPPKQLEPYYVFSAIPAITKENVDKFLPGEW